jgi:hypothetical protein
MTVGDIGVGSAICSCGVGPLTPFVLDLPTCVNKEKEPDVKFCGDACVAPGTYWSAAPVPRFAQAGVARMDTPGMTAPPSVGSRFVSGTFATNVEPLGSSGTPP